MEGRKEGREKTEEKMGFELVYVCELADLLQGSEWR
jgi:hypothetical protein